RRSLSSCLATYRAGDPDQQTCTNEAGNQIANPSAKGDPEKTKDGVGNRCPDDAEHDIHQQAHVTLHELLSQPAGNAAYDNGCNPTYGRVSHGSFSLQRTAPILTSKCSNVSDAPISGLRAGSPRNCVTCSQELKQSARTLPHRAPTNELSRSGPLMPLG